LMTTRVLTAAKDAPKPKTRATLAYRALLVFSFLYFTRPEDIIPGLNVIPVSKISGGIALLALIVSLMGRKTKSKFPLELKALLLLFAHLCLTIPFAYWRGGAFSTVFAKFSKGVIVALLVALIVETVQQLRTLLIVQAGAVAVMTWASVILHPGGLVRMQGVLGGIFENPNDLAVSIAVNWPLVLALMLMSRGPIMKGLWALGLGGMLYGVVATYSRSGSIAMLICFLVCVWEFAIRGRRIHLLVAAGILVVLSTVVVITTPHYLTRMQSIFQGNIEGAGDRGSWEARRELLDDSITLTIQHPIFGVGPGNFPAVTESWHVTHNTYTELSCETGLPGLFLFLFILALAFRNLRRVRKMRSYKENQEVQLFASALWAGLAAYLVGAVFSSTEYTLFPYFMVAYTSALYRIASTMAETSSVLTGKENTVGERRGGIYSGAKPEFVWTR
jgi:putative inorganic carbon (hco3(-)) transporter